MPRPVAEPGGGERSPAAAATGPGAANGEGSERDGAVRCGDGGLLRALGLSLLWPGLGLVAVGARKTGAAIAAVSALALAGAVGWALGAGPARLAALAVTPAVLRTVVLGGLLVLLARIGLGVAVVSRVRSGVEGWEPSARFALLGMATVLAVPHVLVVGRAADQLELLDSVFADRAATVALPTGLDDEPPTEEPTAPELAAAGATADGSASAASDSDVAPDAAIDGTGDAAGWTSWHGRDRLTVAILGSDSGYDRTGVRTDAIIVLSLDVASGDAAVFSVPRNWERMPFPRNTPAARAYPRGFDDLANAVYGMGEARPELFPGSDDPGGAAIKQSLAQLLGIPVDHYVLVGMKAVVDVVDLFGGIDLTVTEYIDDGIGPIEPGGPPLEIETRPGRYHFDGLTTLAYARARNQSSDYNRMSRQRCVIEALVDQVSVLDAVRSYDRLRSIMARHVSTDIPTADLPDLMDLVGRLDTERITTVNFVPPDFPTGSAPVELVRDTVDGVLHPALPVASGDDHRSPRSWDGEAADGEDDGEARHDRDERPSGRTTTAPDRPVADDLADACGGDQPSSAAPGRGGT